MFLLPEKWIGEFENWSIVCKRRWSTHMNAGLVYDSINCTFSFNIRNIASHKIDNFIITTWTAQKNTNRVQQQQPWLQRHHHSGHDNENLKGQPTFLLSSKTEIHLQSTIQILSRMSCFGKYLFAIKQKVKLSGAPVLLMLLRPTWPPLDHYSLGGLRERYSAMEKFSFISMDM